MEKLTKSKPTSNKAYGGLSKPMNTRGKSIGARKPATQTRSTSKNVANFNNKIKNNKPRLVEVDTSAWVMPQEEESKEGNEFIEVTIDGSLELLKERKNTKSIKSQFARLAELKKGVKAIEDCNNDAELIESYGKHGFLEAVQMAWNDHIPLAFSPDHIWTLIGQGFSKHMELNAEQLRSKFVSHQGKKTLRIDLGQYPKMFDAWCDLIKEEIGEGNYANLVPSFTTTDKTAKCIHSLSLMNAMKQYFVYAAGGCGISKIKLLGTLDDWKKLKFHANTLREYDLGWWIDSIDPILDKFIETYEGKVDTQFWSQIYKRWDPDASVYAGQTIINGWLLNFIPYDGKNASVYAQRSLEQINGEIKTYEDLLEKQMQADKESDQNAQGQRRRGRMGQVNEELERARNTGMDQDDVELLSGINMTPWIRVLPGGSQNMQFLSGFVGATMSKDGYIMPQFGWAVCKDDALPKGKPKKSKYEEE